MNDRIYRTFRRDLEALSGPELGELTDQLDRDAGFASEAGPEFNRAAHKVAARRYDDLGHA